MTAGNFVMEAAFKPEITLSNDNNYVLFPFVQPKGTPFIDNMCVQSQPEWSLLNQALTK